ncbi:hypothetical protein XENTR_v10023816 [Xenopus tropicalis]|nr:hypothetical protein XENTR_v10023816 [Xenopus tropicalis]
MLPVLLNAHAGNCRPVAAGEPVVLLRWIGSNTHTVFVVWLSQQFLPTGYHLTDHYPEIAEERHVLMLNANTLSANPFCTIMPAAGSRPPHPPGQLRLTEVNIQQSLPQALGTVRLVSATSCLASGLPVSDWSR